MPRNRVQLLVCDKCGIVRQANYDQSIGQLRELLRGVGWITDNSLDHDLCPECVGARPRIENHP